MSIQDNVLYSEFPQISSAPLENELSHLERDFFGHISVPQLMSNYSKLNDQQSHQQDSPSLQPPTVTLCLEDNAPLRPYSVKSAVGDVGTYSTLERSSLGSHYEVQDPINGEQEETYTQLNLLTKTEKSESHYEPLVSSKEREIACKIIKVSSSSSTSQPWSPEVVYCATHRFIPHHKDEINLLSGDELLLIQFLPDLWVECKNQRTGETGIVPNQYITYYSEQKEAPFQKETFCANFIGSVSTRKGSGREVVKEAMTRILSERRKMGVASVQPVLVEVTGSGVTTHVIGTNSKIPPIHFKIRQVTYSAIQGAKSLAYIVRDAVRLDIFTCYVYETDESVEHVLEIFQKAFDTSKKLNISVANSKS